MSILAGLETGKTGARSYFRNIKTGDRAFLVMRGDIPMIQLDRPNEEIVRKYVAEEWIPDNETRPLTRAQVAMSIKSFDQKLCHFLGHIKLATQDWDDMPDKEKVDWIKGKGPKKPRIRQEAYRRLWELLEGHTRDG